MTTPTKPINITLVDDRLWKSVVADTWTFITIVAVLSIGDYLSDIYMQWVGFFLLIVMFFGYAFANESHMTIAEARLKLDELERGSGSGQL